MNIDSVYVIGKSHRVCQDYAMHGCIDGNPYFIISDGCSSSKDTDIGARILAHSAKTCLTEDIFNSKNHEKSYYSFGHNVIDKATLDINNLKLNPECLDATLIVGFVYNNDLEIYVYGDGCIMYTGTDLKWRCINIKFQTGAPYYLSYWNNKERRNEYLKTFKGLRITDYLNGFTIKESVLSSNCFYFGNISGSALVASDGMSSFFKYAYTQNISTTVKDFTQFKSMTGEFLKRRLNRYVQDMNKQGLYHYDDIAIAGINL